MHVKLQINSSNVFCRHCILLSDIPRKVTWDTMPQSGPSASSRPFQSPIAFTVGLRIEMHTPLGQPIRIPYDTVLLNHGNAYDSINHQFVAPIRGLYSFDISIGPVESCMAILVVNGVYRVMTSEHVCDRCYGGAATSAILMLEAGEAAWVVMENGALHSGNDALYGDVPRNTFSGYLYAEL